jgi:hypothetical protein
VTEEEHLSVDDAYIIDLVIPEALSFTDEFGEGRQMALGIRAHKMVDGKDGPEEEMVFAMPMFFAARLGHALTSFLLAEIAEGLERIENVPQSTRATPSAYL